MTSIDTVNDLPRRVQYTAAPAQTEFDYTFPIFVKGDLAVDMDGTPLAVDTDYTVAGMGNDNGGTITLITPASGSEVVTIVSDVAYERDTDVSQDGPWDSDAYNDELDKIMILLQQVRDSVKRCLRIPVTAEAVDDDMALDPAVWASRFMSFDSDGTPLPVVLSATAITETVLNSLYTSLTPAALAVIADPTKRTAAEIAASVTPTNYEFAPGDIRRYGAALTNPDNTAYISRAIAQAKQIGSGAAIYVPPGNWVGDWIFSGTFTGIRVYGDGMQLSVCTGTSASNNVFDFPSGSSVWGVTIEHLNIVGGLNGIHLNASMTFAPFSLSLRHLQIEDSANSGILDEKSAFTTVVEDVIVTGCTGHGIDIFGGNTCVLKQCYPQVIPTGTGKAGYRVHSGAPLMIGCNGVNTGDYWAIFGNTVADDGQVNYCIPTLDRCNVESFTVAGVLNKNGGVTVRGNTQFLSHLAGNIAIKMNPTNGAVRGTLDHDNAFTNSGGAWLNTYPVHVFTASGEPFMSVASGTPTETFTWYDEVATAAVTMATIVPITVVGTTHGYGIHDLYVKGVLRGGASGSVGVFGATPIVQPTTGVGAAAFVAGSGTAVNDASTFGGYTLKQVVKALQNLGLLA